MKSNEDLKGERVKSFKFYVPSSCLENPRDGGAWWAAVYGFAQSRTRLKRLSSSSSSREYKNVSLLEVPS